MGLVKMKVETSFISRGYSYHTATLYVYCDKCGSFDIRTFLTLRKWFLIASPGALAAAVAVEFRRSGIVYIWWVLLGLVAIAVAFMLFWGDPDFKCGKCGHIPTTKYNTLSYPSTMDILDVPDELAKKRYLGYWPDEYDLDFALTPPAKHAASRTED